MCLNTLESVYNLLTKVQNGNYRRQIFLFLLGKHLGYQTLLQIHKLIHTNERCILRDTQLFFYRPQNEENTIYVCSYKRVNNINCTVLRTVFQMYLISLTVRLDLLLKCSNVSKEEKEKWLLKQSPLKSVCSVLCASPTIKSLKKL